MTIRPQTAVNTTRHARMRRHCSIICVALVVARFTPAITLAEPAPSTPVRATASTAPSATTFPLSVYVCPTRDLCGTVTVTISVAPRDTVQW
jgi:hypothetical protein